MFKPSWNRRWLTNLALAILTLTATFHTTSAEDAPAKVSYQTDILPIFQARCHGCHQPAKPGGGYDLTQFPQLYQAGESGEAAIVPGKPDESALLSLITPVDGKADMPKKGPPLTSTEIERIRLWIEQGAIDDSPSQTQEKYDQNHPPVYSRPPLVTSIAASPDGTLLAVAGFHEVLLRSADGTEPRGRLVGLSERIESIAFSPDGTRLAVAGGNPGRMGELQIWDVASQELQFSLPLTADTIYGASWSPDGKLVAVGASDNAVRAFDAETGEQVFFNAVHEDWPLATVFSVDGSLLVSASRDMSTKLYNVPTQRFIDNVTSITPGALKGGISSLQRHPTRNQILVGGSDGTPRIYRMERVIARKIGDDANLVRSFPSMEGRIYSVSYSPDGERIACGSSLDGHGQVAIYRAGDLPEATEEIQAILKKMEKGPSEEELKKLHDYLSKNPQLLLVHKISIPSPVYALTYSPDGTNIIAAGGDGLLRFINPDDGTIRSEVLPVEITPQQVASTTTSLEFKHQHQTPLSGQESLPPDAEVIALEVSPQSVSLTTPFDSVQLLVTGVLKTGDRIDLTRLATLQSNINVVTVSPLGRVFPRQDGKTSITVHFQELQVSIPVSVTGLTNPTSISFIRDVNPVLTRLGCNQGTCHGSKDGKNGFKLSLRGYDPLFDVRSLTDDLKSRRTNVASPDSSLMLLKASGAVPHMGGQLTRPGEAYYEIIRRWIAEGTRLDLDVERVTSIQIEPHNPVVQTLGSRQQLRVIATYSNGATRDVTGDAFLESGNTEVAESNRSAVLTAIRRGEAPVLARYEGNYAATTLTAMGDRTGFVWKEPESWGRIDELVTAKWERMKIQPSELCSDTDFIRRVYLDLTGLPPSAEEVLFFCADPRPTQEKRAAVIDKLIGSEAYIDYWTNKWADLLQVNSKFLGTEGATQFRGWIRERVAANQPYDQFCREILTATGSNKANPPASYFKILRDPDLLVENTTHLFLAIRFNCNKCHDHPFERWTQDQYYETAAFFAQLGLKRDPANAEGNIGGTAVEGAKPLWEEIYDNKTGEIKHDRTGQVTPPVVPFDRDIPLPPDGTRRQQLAAWITSPENDYFARSYVNRMWGYLMGVGLIEPIDDIRAGNPPSNPELLDYLTDEFINSGFNVRHLVALICKSRTYQLSIATNKWNEDDRLNYSHALPKRLPAEVLYDAIYSVTGARMQIPGVPEGTRAAALPDVKLNLEDGFLDSLGRPARESACECERSSDLQLGPVMALMNGPTVSQAISQPGNRLEQLVQSEPDDFRLVNKVFLNVLNRPARPDEVQALSQLLQGLNPELQKLIAERDRYRESIRAVVEQQQEKRRQAIADAKKTLEEYISATKEKVEADIKAREEAIAAAQKALDDYQARGAERVAQWEQGAVQSPTPWKSIKFDALKSNLAAGAKLTQEEDFTIRTNRKNGTGEFTLECDGTSLGKVTALKLEALSDEKLPAKGPGQAENGNFVLTELTLEYWDKNTPNQVLTAALKNAKASFSQDNFDVSQAIDGNATDSRNGWAIAPQLGKDHFATFELTEAVEFTPDHRLRIRMSFQYPDRKHVLAKFKVKTTDQEGEVNEGVPESLQAIVSIPASERTPEQFQALLAYVNQVDPEFSRLNKELQKAKEPLPVDPKLVELQEALQEAEQPIPVDPQMARLDRAVELAQKQLENRRLTAVQDLTWALINSPAFLFNR